jgi:hypothetical protein
VGAIPDEELRKRQWAGLMEFTMVFLENIPNTVHFSRAN